MSNPVWSSQPGDKYSLDQIKAMHTGKNARTISMKTDSKKYGFFKKMLYKISNLFGETISITTPTKSNTGEVYNVSKRSLKAFLNREASYAGKKNPAERKQWVNNIINDIQENNNLDNIITGLYPKEKQE